MEGKGDRRTSSEVTNVEGEEAAGDAGWRLPTVTLKITTTISNEYRRHLRPRPAASLSPFRVKYNTYVTAAWRRSVHYVFRGQAVCHSREDATRQGDAPVGGNTAGAAFSSTRTSCTHPRCYDHSLLSLDTSRRNVYVTHVVSSSESIKTT